MSTVEPSKNSTLGHFTPGPTVNDSGFGRNLIEGTQRLGAADHDRAGTAADRVATAMASATEHIVEIHGTVEPLARIEPLLRNRYDSRFSIPGAKGTRPWSLPRVVYISCI